MKKLIIIAVLVVLGVAAILSMKAKRIDNPLPANGTADKVLIEKSKHRLTLLNRNIPIKTYKISLGKEPIGKKTEEGDGRTPEGGQSSSKSKRRIPRRRHHDSRPSEWHRLYRKSSHNTRLDTRLHSCNEFRYRGDMANSSRWDYGRDCALETRVQPHRGHCGVEVSLQGCRMTGKVSKVQS
jgi:hypothetical protein